MTDIHTTIPCTRLIYRTSPRLAAAVKSLVQPQGHVEHEVRTTQALRSLKYLHLLLRNVLGPEPVVIISRSTQTLSGNWCVLS